MTDIQKLPLDIPVEIQNRIIEMFGEPYQYARGIIIHGETLTLERQWIGMSNLRDAFDHFINFIGFINSGCIDHASDELTEVEEHIRRASVETAQIICEILLDEINSKISIPPFVFKMTFVDYPSDVKIQNVLHEVKVKMESARTKKSKKWKEAIQEFKEAETLLVNLNIQLPSSNNVKYRLFTIAVGVLGFIGGILV